MWNGSNISAPLYTSSVQFGPTVNAQRYTFNTGALAVTDGAVYIAFLSVADLLGDISASVDQSDDASSNGEAWFAFTNDLGALGNAEEAQWLNLGGQLRFEATFGAAAEVPEPSSVLLLGAALAGLVMVARRRRAA